MPPLARGAGGSTSRVLLVGASTRAIAESAARAGHTVWALDAFGDLDLRRCAHVPDVPSDAWAALTPRTATRLASSVAVDAVAYTGGWENHAAAVARLARGRELLGNAPRVLRRVRDPEALAAVLRAAALPAPRVHGGEEAPPRRGRWLVKRRASAGGAGVTRWTAGARVPGGAYLQEYVAGTPASVVFAANGRDAVPLAFTRQLVGEHAFGATGFRYCGSILAGIADPQLGASVERALAADVAREIARAFGLVGLNGVDLIVRDGVPFAIEVNPRWTASMELVERACGLSMFATHVAACRGVLPAVDDGAWAWRGGAIGKAVVYARTDVITGDTRAWLEGEGVRDVPAPGECIARGRPICTIFARARTAAGCHAALERAAARVHAALRRVGRAA